MNPHDLGWALVVSLAQKWTPLPYILFAAKEASVKSPDPEKFFNGAIAAADLITSLSWTKCPEATQC